MLATALILAQIPPPLTVVNGIDADDLYNITTGDPGTCQCESPKCGAPGAGTRIMHGESKKFGPAGGCYYFALGGGIKASGDGMICRTWRADSKGCNIYPGSTDGNCSRILTTPCSVASHRQKAQSAATEPSLYSSGMSSNKFETSPTTKYPPCDGNGSMQAAVRASASTLRFLR